MRTFLLKITGFFLLVVLVLTASLFFVPDIVAQRSLLAAIVDKHAMLDKIRTKKVIFIGGSNVSFGLDSKSISNTFQKPVINMGVHAGLGLKYIVNESKPYIKKGDIVVLAPEYENFYTDNFYGEMELVSVLFDLDKEGKKNIDAEQWRYLYKYIPTYSAKKIKNYVSDLIHTRSVTNEIDIYDRRSFNDFGDAYIHWVLPDQGYEPSKRNKGSEKVNACVTSFLVDFKKYIQSMGAEMILLPPVIEERSFENQKDVIRAISIDLEKNGLAFYSLPERYKFRKDLFFNSYYHPNKKGVDLRTKLVIEDIKRTSKEAPLR